MRPLSKAALYLSISGVLALLVTYVPSLRAKSKPTNGAVPARQVQPAPVPPKASGGGNGSEDAIPAQAILERDPAHAVRVKVPAIRGASNYGWVQLPRGTQVELVRQSHRELFVKWDGTLVKIDPAWAAEGAVIVTKSPRG